jgi:hypothetical protein
MDWDVAIAEFARYLASERGYSPKTSEVYLAEVAALRDGIAARRAPRPPLAPAQVDAIEVRRHLAALFDGNRPATIGKKLSALRGFFRFLHKRGAIAGNPASALRGPKKPKPLPRALDVDDTFRLVEAPAGGPRPTVRRRGADEEARAAALAPATPRCSRSSTAAACASPRPARSTSAISSAIATAPGPSRSPAARAASAAWCRSAMSRRARSRRGRRFAPGPRARRCSSTPAAVA